MKPRASRAPKATREYLRRLEEIRNRFSPGEAAEKRALLENLRRAEILEPALLRRYHEALLFVRSYPDNARLFRLACAECNGFARRVGALSARDRGASERLDDTGIAGTTIRYAYDHEIARRLAGWYGNALDIDWEAFEETGKLDALLPLVAHWMESDGLDLANLSTEEWVEAARGTRGKSSLEWLLERLDALPAPPAVKRHLYDSIEIPVIWRLGKSSASRTRAVHTGSPPFFHGEPLLRKVEDFRREVERPVIVEHVAKRRDARMLIRLVTTALAVRHRSLYPIENASPEDVLVADPGRGYRVALYGMRPASRLPLESDYGALLLKNGFPIGYGVGAMLFDRMEIAVNLFDTWRGGEAGFLFAQFVRVFHAHFGSARFKIVNYQVGHENEEGLKSGSFWFYHKLGFIPKDAGVRRLADRELARIRKNKAYRTPIATLKKLAVSDLYFALRGDPHDIPEDFPLADLAVGTTRMIAERHHGDGARAERDSAARMAEILSCPDWRMWPAAERLWFARLSVVMARIPDLESWQEDARGELAALMRAKGKPSEVEFARRMARAVALEAALRKVAAAPTSLSPSSPPPSA